MEPQPTNKTWVMNKEGIFEDSRQLKKWQVGRFIRTDAFLWIVDFGDGHVAVRPSEVICLAG
jgi:hypothetical protein